MKLIFFIFFIALTLSACQGCNHPQVRKDAGQTQPEVILVVDSLPPDTIALGHVIQGETIRKELLLRNGKNHPMMIFSAAASCGCTTVEFERKPVLPGKDAQFAFEFNSTGFIGYQLKYITVRTSLSKKPFTLVVTAEVDAQQE